MINEKNHDRLEKTKSPGLLEGLNFSNLKAKYQKNMELKEIEKFEEENQTTLYNEPNFSNIITNDLVII